VSPPRSAIAEVHRALLEWYEPRKRAYPWRVRPTPYRVLVSEVMLQQTQAARVVAPYRSFLRRFPSVRALAAAPRGDVLRAWSGLGYNRRALALSDMARAVVRDHGGRIPSDPDALQGLPGIGPYTAAAVASLGHGRPEPLVETNVRRVLGRVAVGGAGAADPKHMDEIASVWLDREHPSEWNQALMDLGREVCRPRPRCETCPIRSRCRSAGRVTVSPAVRRQSAFEGSLRQVRGGVIEELRGRGSSSLGSLARSLGASPGRVAEAVRALAEEGLVSAGPAALGGALGGRVRLIS